MGRHISPTLGVVLCWVLRSVFSHPHSASHPHFTIPSLRRPPPSVHIPRDLDPSTCPPDFKDHPLILISMDGFRADFIERGLTPTIAKLSKRGVYAPYIKPSYPSITFPNHYTIVTGLLPPAHGIVANRFTDPVFNASFAPGNPESFQKRFWGGEPVWKTIERQGQIAATYFWPGSEVTGNTPTYWYPFSKLTPFNVRVNQVLAWLDLPSHHRPRFMTLYMHEPDEMGHDFGPDSPQINEALGLVDETVRQLVAGIQKRGLLSCVNLLVLADHGMTTAGPERVIQLRDVVPNFNTKVTSLWNGIFARFNSKDRSFGGTQRLMEELSCKRRPIKVYHKNHAPARWHIGGQRRIEDIVLDLDKGYQADGDGTYKPDVGDHGYDNYIADMNALFLAHGPAFRRGLEVEAFQNTELYNLMCLITDTLPAPNNGTWGALHHLLKEPPVMPHHRKAFLVPRVATLSADREEFEERIEESECHPSGSIQDWWQPLAQAQGIGLAPLSFWHAPWGMPNIQEEELSGALLLLQQTHITGYSRVLKTPLWTSFVLDASSGSKPASTPRTWLPDPRLHGDDDSPVCATERLLASTYTSWQPLYRPEFSSFSRSYPVLSSNAVVMSQELEGAWDALVAAINSWRKQFGAIHVLVGPAFDSDGDTIRDSYHHWRAEEGGVVLPTHLFAVLTRCHLGYGGLHSCPHDHLDTLAFILPQHLPVSNCQTPTEFLREFSAKVKDVELITGLSLYPGLAPEDRIRQQIRIHSNLWGRETWGNRLHSKLFGLKR